MVFHPVSCVIRVYGLGLWLGLGLRFCIRVSITGSVSYLNNKFVVVLDFVVPSVDHSILPGGDRSG